MEIIEVNLRDIKPYKRNAKKHTKEQVKQIAESIKQFGFVVPVLLDGENTVIAGHGRCMAAKLLKMQSVPCLKQDRWTKEQVKAFRLIDNKVAESGYDKTLMDQELTELFKQSKIDMNLFGFSKVLSGTSLEKEIKFKVKEKHLVIVTCESTKETIRLQEILESKGYKCEVKNTIA